MGKAKKEIGKVLVIGNTHIDARAICHELAAHWHQNIEIINPDEIYEKIYPQNILDNMPLRENIKIQAPPIFVYESDIPKKMRGVIFSPVRNSKENPKPSRNKPCPCGSGKKYKHCCVK